jgi:1-acyl-sn-glycerol-3-phosphate acyltransferase
MIRGIIFTGVYYLLSAIYVIVSLPFLALPGRGPVTLIIRSYTRALNLALRLICGIKKDVRGRENLPDGPFVIAAKHSSWGDGFMIYPEVKGMAFVTGDHLEKFPLGKESQQPRCWYEARRRRRSPCPDLSRGPSRAEGLPLSIQARRLAYG